MLLSVEIIFCAFSTCRTLTLAKSEGFEGQRVLVILLRKMVFRQKTETCIDAIPFTCLVCLRGVSRYGYFSSLGQEKSVGEGEILHGLPADSN